jgi:hypothetical protein
MSGAVSNMKARQIRIAILTATVALFITLVANLGIVLAQSTVSPQTADARTEARKIWEKVLTRCGDSYYFFESNHKLLYEYKDVSFSVSPSRALTRADQLNGVEWAGVAFMLATADRYRTETGRWEMWGALNAESDRRYDLDPRDWENSGFLHLPNVFKMAKINGRWSFWSSIEGATDIPVDLTKNTLSGPSCVSIPETAEFESARGKNGDPVQMHADAKVNSIKSDKSNLTRPAVPAMRLSQLAAT